METQLRDEDIQSWSIQILKGIEFLHSNSLIHRDIKPGYAYILFYSDNLMLIYFHQHKNIFINIIFGNIFKIFQKILRNIFLHGRDLVIGDLGHAKALEKSSPNENSSIRSFGTSNYLAPEANDSIKTEKIDIWFVLQLIYVN